MCSPSLDSTLPKTLVMSKTLVGGIAWAEAFCDPLDEPEARNWRPRDADVHVDVYADDATAPPPHI